MALAPGMAWQPGGGVAAGVWQLKAGGIMAYQACGVM